MLFQKKGKKQYKLFFVMLFTCCKLFREPFAATKREPAESQEGRDGRRLRQASLLSAQFTPLADAYV